MDDVDDEPIKKRSKATDGDGLEDSDDDEDDDDDDDDDDDASASSDKKRKKLRKIRALDELDDDDLALINEAKGITNTSTNNKGDDDGVDAMDDDVEAGETNHRPNTVKAKSAQELSRGLFTGDTDSEDEDGDNKKQSKKKKQAALNKQQSSNKPERYDEDGLDDFIEDDTGYGLEDDDDDYGRTGGGLRGDKGAISEAQINEAEEIFGTDYLDFMDGGGEEEEEEPLDEDYDPNSGGRKRRKSKFKEAGVGVDLGVDSDEEIQDDSSDDDSDDDDDDDADLFGDDDMDDMGYKQRAEVLKLKREKKRLAREERRRQKRERVDAKRKAQLRRAFEPVQLVENFCTEKDDAIRMADLPERYYDWLEAKKSKKGSTERKVLAIGDEIDMEEEEEAMWIMSKIPAFSSEIATAVSNATAAAAATSSAGGENAMVPDTDDVMEKADRTIIESIVYALRYMRGEKLEPEFIKRYRVDIVTSPAVRDNLYRIMDEDSEWERMTEARTKIEGVLQSFKEEEEEPAGRNGCPEVERAARLKEKFKIAEEKLNETVEQERKVQEQLDELEKTKEKGDDDDDDDDDDLFGDDDEDDEAVSFSISESDFSCLFQVNFLLILCMMHSF